MKKVLALAIIASITIIFTVSANAAVGTVVYCYKTDTQPNLEEIDESWGEPAIYVDKNSPNTELHKYWTEEMDTNYYKYSGTGVNGRTTIEPEPSDFWMYLLFDDKSIYVGIKSPDAEPCGAPLAHRGDGARMWIQPLSDMADPYSGYGVDKRYTEYDPEYQYLEQFYHFYWNISENMQSVDKLFAGFRAEVANIKFIDGYMHAILKVSLADIGVGRTVERNGLELGTAIMRCSSRSAFDEGYAGWLSWGNTLPDYTPLPTSVNTIILVDPDAEHPADQTEPIATEPIATEPVVTEPVVTEPVVTESVETEPIVTEPVVTEPVVTEPVVTEPVVTEPIVTESVETDLVATEPVVTEPVVTESVVTEPVVTEPVETDLVVTEPVVTEPVVTEPVVTEPIESEIPTTEPVKNKNNNAGIIAIAAAVIASIVAVAVAITQKKK